MQSVSHLARSILVLMGKIMKSPRHSEYSELLTTTAGRVGFSGLKKSFVHQISPRLGVLIVILGEHVKPQTAPAKVFLKLLDVVGEAVER